MILEARPAHDFACVQPMKQNGVLSPYSLSKSIVRDRNATVLVQILRDGTHPDIIRCERPHSRASTSFLIEKFISGVQKPSPRRYHPDWQGHLHLVAVRGIEPRFDG